MLDFVIDKIFVLFGRRVFNRLVVVQWYSMTSLYIFGYKSSAPWFSPVFGRPVLLIILAFCIVLCVYLLFVFVLCYLCPMLPMSLVYTFMIAHLVFSNVQL